MFSIGKGRKRDVAGRLASEFDDDSGEDSAAEKDARKSAKKKLAADYIIPIAEEHKAIVNDDKVAEKPSRVPLDPTKYGLQIRKVPSGERDVTPKYGEKPLLIAARDSAKPEADESKTDYESIPVEFFGSALLKGMGWKEGQAIGKNPERGMVEPVSFAKRHNLLGLGADPDQLGLKPIGGGGKDSGAKEWIGIKVTVTKGKFEGMIGSVASVDAANFEINIEATGERVLLPRDHFDDKGTEKEKPGVSKKHSQISAPPPPPSSSSSSSSKKCWIFPHLKVRIVSKSFAGGRFFNRKGVIEDVISNDGVCIIRTDNGEIINEISQAHLETTIPKVIGEPVLVVNGSRKGKKGHLMERRPGKEEAVIQFDDDSNRLHTFHFDDICAFSSDQ